MTIRQIINSTLVTPQTAAVLNQRLNQLPVEDPLFFNQLQFKTLKAVCGRLIPQSGDKQVDLAGNLDKQLFNNEGNGWRYDELPDDKEVNLAGMDAIERTAVEQHQISFHLLVNHQQDDILAAVQQNNVNTTIWQINASLYFEELLCSIVEIYYTFPQAKEAMNDLSMADAIGWKSISLNNYEDITRLSPQND